jgi:hypothetical protein
MTLTHRVKRSLRSAIRALNSQFESIDWPSNKMLFFQKSADWYELNGTKQPHMISRYRGVSHFNMNADDQYLNSYSKCNKPHNFPLVAPKSSSVRSFSSNDRAHNARLRAYPIKSIVDSKRKSTFHLKTNR